MYQRKPVPYSKWITYARMWSIFGLDNVDIVEKLCRFRESGFREIHPTPSYLRYHAARAYCDKVLVDMEEDDGVLLEQLMERIQNGP